jgi:lysophospholipase L1-like esterase
MEGHVRIALLGDSLTEGAPGASFVRILRTQLGADGRADADELLNLGRAGDGVADLYARVQLRGLEHVDLAIVWIGTNDAAVGEWSSWAFEAFEPVSWSTTLDHIATVYRRLLAWVTERAAATVCVPPVAADGLEGAWERRVADVAEMVAAAAAASPGASFLDLAPWFAAARAEADAAAAGGPVSFTIDGVHLSQAGAQVVADAFASAIAARRPPSA